MSVDGKAHIAGVLRAPRGPVSADGMRCPTPVTVSPSAMVQQGKTVANVALPTTVSEYSPKKHPLQPHDGTEVVSEESISEER